MLKIARNPEFTHDVTVRVPVDGGFADQKFKARFRVIPWAELNVFERDADEQTRMVWVGWDGIVDDADVPIPFSDSMRDTLISLPFVRMAVLNAYVDAVAGAKRGN
ncbi:phage tail assembly chaperone [Pararhodobacter zhoushanensis]|uniref:Phage tail assembly chaperone n=1 Tax=Pararhodobacter zhoushanensis TaxID=2479545 RepID=A0ABT3H2Q5_9RHOB|nr:phage tail assembly chaperone [Pararhodobacter zhoushanensis]MCW1934121.1 phage tail assembly chaperone [Pararhodobacter zhoushanensis]